MVVGLCLKENRANTFYTVVPHVHNLTRPFGAVSLTLSYPIRNKRNTYYDDFTLKSHEREFPDACVRLHKQTLFPLGESLSISQIVHAYDLYMEKNLGLYSPEFMYEDILCLLSWCGQSAEASKRLSKYIDMMSSWDETTFDRVGGPSAFFGRLVDIVAGPNALAQICEEQIELLKLEKIPDYGLTC